MKDALKRHCQELRIPGQYRKEIQSYPSVKTSTLPSQALVLDHARCWHIPGHMGIPNPGHELSVDTLQFCSWRTLYACVQGDILKTWKGFRSAHIDSKFSSLRYLALGGRCSGAGGGVGGTVDYCSTNILSWEYDYSFYVLDLSVLNPVALSHLTPHMSYLTPRTPKEPNPHHNHPSIHESITRSRTRKTLINISSAGAL